MISTISLRFNKGDIFSADNRSANTKKHVFVSYSSNEKELVTQICNRIKVSRFLYLETLIYHLWLMRLGLAIR